MEKIITVLEIVVPIFVVIFLGILAKRKSMLSQEENRGLQQFVTKFALPCVLFNSCYTANLGAESVTTMALMLPFLLASALWSFKARKKNLPYYNIPLLFSAQESGMLGIPLFIALFGAEQAYRMGVLDITQAFVAIPVIAILGADVGENPTVSSIVKKVFQSPLLLMSILGLALNLTGAAAFLNTVGIGGVITETTGFIAQPVSAVILFTVGYNFSLGEGSRGKIAKLCAFHFALFAVFGIIIEGILSFLPSVDMETRIAILIYFTLPPSFLTPGFGKNEEEYTLTSGVCSILTVVCLAVFCVIAGVVA